MNRCRRIEWCSSTGTPQRKSEFRYDYASRRAVSAEFTWTAGAWVQGSETRRVFDRLDSVQERNALNEVTASYVRDGNIGGILSRSSPSGTSFFHYDGNGNVVTLSDEQGALAGHYSYDAFGNTLEVVGPRAQHNPFRFSTKELHAASGLYDYGLRFYSPGTGRWLNRDPIRESGGLNIYAMVGNDPVNGSDEYGLSNNWEWRERQRYNQMPWYGKAWHNAKPYAPLAFDIATAVMPMRMGRMPRMRLWRLGPRWLPGSPGIKAGLYRFQCQPTCHSFQARLVSRQGQRADHTFHSLVTWASRLNQTKAQFTKNLLLLPLTRMVNLTSDLGMDLAQLLVLLVDITTIVKMTPTTQR